MYARLGNHFYIYWKNFVVVMDIRAMKADHVYR